MEDKLTVKVAENKREISDAREIRKQVFQSEQGIDSKLDFDGKDEKAEHIIAYFGNKAVGTARVRYLREKTAKIERVSILKECRGKGIGRSIIEYIISYFQDKGVEKIMLDSQEQVKGFYEKLCFKQKGGSFPGSRSAAC